MPGPLATFFARYSGFNYKPSKSATAEFYRLCDSNHWRKEDKEREVAQEGFQDALTMQFNDNYGTDVNDLTKWQALCARLRVKPLPTTLHKCREVVRGKHVNLVDLVDTFGTRKQVRIFQTVVALSEYTKETGKYFPGNNAQAGNLLKFLLRQIMNPELSSNEGGRGHNVPNARGRRGHARGRGSARGRGGRRGRA